MKKMFLSFTLVLLLFLSTFLMINEINHEEFDDREFDICDDGLIFAKLDVYPDFESEAQKKFYVDQYKYEAGRCN